MAIMTDGDRVKKEWILQEENLLSNETIRNTRRRKTVVFLEPGWGEY